MIAKYKLKFFFDSGGAGALWANDGRTRLKFGYDVDPHAVGLSESTILENKRLSEYFDTVIDNDPTAAQIKNFRAEAFGLYQSMLTEIGDRFEIQYLE